MDRTEEDRAPIYIADGVDGVVTASQFHPVCTTAQIDIVLDDDAVQTFFVGDAISCRDIAVEFLVAATRFDNATPQVEPVEHSVAAPDLFDAAVASINAIKSGESGIARLYLEHALSMTMKTDEDEPVEHSVDLDILAQTIGEHISFNPDEYDFARDIADALKAEFKGQSVHMREDEPVANPDAPTRISDLAGSRLEPGQ
jgi:hypothetical protein